MTDILDEVKKVLEERKKEYGPFKDSLHNIASMWAAYFKIKYPNSAFMFTDEDVAIMFILFKIVRESNEHKDDNIRDMIGYAVGLGECYE